MRITVSLCLTLLAAGILAGCSQVPTDSATETGDNQAPSVPAGLAVSATTIGALNLTWNASTDAGGSGVAGYRVMRNGTLISGATPVTAPAYVDVGLAASTTYSYAVAAVDNAGNVSATSAAVAGTTLIVTTPDTTAPSVPQNLRQTSVAVTQASLAWDASTDTGGSNLAGYRVYRNGTLVSGGALVTGTSYTDSGLAANTSYSYTVRAVDGAGNVSADSAALGLTTAASPDTTPPTAPQNLHSTAATSTQITLAWTASTDTGGSGLSGYRVYLGGTLVNGSTLVAATTYNVTGLNGNTSYTFTVRAVDGAGNVSGDSNPLVASTSASADTTPPTVPQNLRSTGQTTSQISLAWDASTDSGGSNLAGYRVFRGGTLVSGSSLVTTTGFIDTGLTANTAYNYTVVAVDGAGNTSGSTAPLSVSTPVSGDLTAPSVPQNLRSTTITATTAGLAWDASTDTGGSGLAGYRVYRNGALVSGSSLVTGATYTDNDLSAATSYSYTVRAVDGAGNTSADSSVATVTTLSSGTASAYGLDSRPGNASCVAPNEPGVASSYTFQRVYANRSFGYPVKMLQAPGDASRWYVVSQTGKVNYFSTSDTSGSAVTTFVDLSGRVDFTGETGLLGMAFHPNFASNHYVYLSYVVASSPVRTVISRFTSNGVNLDLGSELVLLTIERPDDHHAGGSIAFGPDGYLYIVSGDGNQAWNKPQTLDNFFGKMLRIDVDHTAQGANYAIPASNPFNSGAPAMCPAGTTSGTTCPEIYAYGLRNPWGWSFDRSTGQLWAGDVGENTYEEIDIITSGSNYGWPIKEGFHYVGSQSNVSGLTDPVAEYDHSVGQAITGGYVYRGSALTGLVGRYLFGDFVAGGLFDIDPASPATRVTIANTGLMISSFAEDVNGEVYFTDYSGGLYEIISGSGGSNTIPTLLSATGCFSNMATQTVASGLIPYTINAPFWSDGAEKARYMGIPDGATITVGSDGDFAFPTGTVLMKNFRLNGQIIETRLFVRYSDTGNWGGHSYRWNSQQTEATLVTDATTVTIGSQSWLYPSSAQCSNCHTAAAGYALGPETLQLNGSFTYPSTGRSANQLATLNHIGMFSSPLADPSTLAALPDPSGTAPVKDRARAYLHSNCAGCHRPNNPIPASMNLLATTSMADTNTCNVSPASDVGLGSSARIIVPGNPALSVLHARMNQRGSNQMPPLASFIVDSNGAALLSQWITAMDGSCN